MAERRLAERPAMQLVGLDDDAMDGSSPVRSAPERLHDAALDARGWASRRPAWATAAILTVLAVLVTGVVGGPRWLTAREREAVLGPAAFAGAVASLHSPPQVHWTADIDGTTTPLLVGDVVVAAAGTVERDRRIVGLDAVTGETRWTLPLASDPVPSAVMCKSASALLACVVGPVPSGDRRDLVSDADTAVGVATLWAIDPVDGTVRAQHPIDGWVMSTAAAGTDLVVATYTFGLLTVTRLDPLTARPVWQMERFVTARSASNGRIRLVVAGGLVMAQGNDSTLLLDAATGERQPRPAEALGVDESRLTADGTLVRVQYRLIDSAIVARSSLSDGAGEPWLTAEGSVLNKDVSDGASGLVLTADGLGEDGVGAYRVGVDEPVWTSTAPATRVSVDAEGRVVVRNGGTLAALDAGSGETVWVRDLGAVSGPALSDGRSVAVLSGGTNDPGELVALDLQTGELEWVWPMPESTSRVVQLGTQLYALGDGVLVALR